MAKGISNKKLAEIQALNKKVIAKKKRIEKKYGITTPEIQPIDTSLRGKALKDSIEMANSFTNPHNQKYQYKKNSKGVVFTKSELTKTKLKIDMVNRIKARELDKLDSMPFSVEGRNVTTVGQRFRALNVNVDEKYQLRFNPEMFKSRAHFEKWLSKKEGTYGGDFIKKNRHQYRANYFSALREVFGDSSDVDKLIGLLEQMSVDDFYVKSITADEREIQYIYEERRRTGVLQTIGESWGIDLGLALES